MTASEECCSICCFQNLSKDNGKFLWWKGSKQREKHEVNIKWVWGHPGLEKWFSSFKSTLIKKYGTTSNLLSIAYVKSFYNISDKWACKGACVKCVIRSFSKWVQKDWKNVDFILAKY